MPAAMEPTQQAAMTADNGDIVTQQPVCLKTTHQNIYTFEN
jgi:hypothetical protein